eukprot:CAMPEP_0206143212 /NCGR_PEP_ID=MMETSP1473-20131121/19651_1 /ASSEMBLY_ACC=CAM_ASM_001109 /TAXON_ID=1461547 /ORGANISM="Stichococcus sp, Strain RCC1054" /LENGTH=41 /DNA_ID= /DNA_START= /DNA_END= /DNA_ORIENTATION=
MALFVNVGNPVSAKVYVHQVASIDLTAEAADLQGRALADQD